MHQTRLGEQGRGNALVLSILLLVWPCSNVDASGDRNVDLLLLQVRHTKSRRYGAGQQLQLTVTVALE